MKYHLLFIIAITALLFLASCTDRNDMPVADEPEIIAVASSITLQPDSTWIVLNDYFRHPNSIDSIRTDAALGYLVSADSNTLTLFPISKSIPKLSVMEVWAGGFKYSLLIRKSPKLWYRFVFDPKEKKYKNVYLAGDMNDWNPGRNPMKLKDGKWEEDVLVNPGKYQYKFIVDGKWIQDPGSRESLGGNSVVHIGSVNPPAVPLLYTVKTEKEKITVGMRNKAEEVFVLWQNYQLDAKFFRIDSNLLSITIPGAAARFDRSAIRVYAMNGSGVSNEILIPLAGREVILAPGKLERTDPHAMIIYFLMIDRFMNGSKENDAPLADPEVDPKVNFFGGDLAGIIQKTDDGYFTDLGVNTIWISPLTQNPTDAWREYPAPHRKFSGYHGYWPITLTTVDTRFGTSGELKKLVGEAHDKNMNVLLDYASNHVHKESAIYKQHPDWATVLDLPNGKKNIRLWNEQRLTTWFDEFLPTLDLSKPEVYEMMSDSQVFWIREYGIDGFRHDAAKHVPEVYWRTLTKKINDQVVVPEKRSVYQIGETFGSRELIKSYISPGMMDAQFDFSVYFDATTAFGQDNTSLKDLNASLYESFFYFGNHHVMGNITGNQDLTRFITVASGALSPSEDATAAGWERDIEVRDTIGYKKLSMLMAFNMTVPGIPVIYYGDEFGMPGAGDPDNRRMMRFDSLTPWEAQTRSLTRQLVNLRKNSMPLLYGDFRTLEAGEKTWVFIRSYFDKAVIVILNKDRSERTIDFEIPARFADAKFIANFGHALKIGGGKATVTLKGNSFEIFSN